MATAAELDLRPGDVVRVDYACFDMKTQTSVKYKGPRALVTSANGLYAPRLLDGDSSWYDGPTAVRFDVGSQFSELMFMGYQPTPDEEAEIVADPAKFGYLKVGSGLYVPNDTCVRYLESREDGHMQKGEEVILHSQFSLLEQD